MNHWAFICAEAFMEELMQHSRWITLILAFELILWGCKPPGSGASDVQAAGTSPSAAVSESQLDDREQPVSVARRFAKTIADDDPSTAAALMLAPTPNHRRLAQSVCRLFCAYHRVRREAISRIGEAEAKRLPMNDAGTFFIDRMTSRIDGDSATVTWKDNFGPDGTSRDLEFVRASGQWRVSLKSFTSGNGPETAREVIDAIGETNSFTRDLETVESRIKSGELNTFEAIRRAS